MSQNYFFLVSLIFLRQVPLQEMCSTGAKVHKELRKQPTSIKEELLKDVLWWIFNDVWFCSCSERRPGHQILLLLALSLPGLGFNPSPFQWQNIQQPNLDWHCSHYLDFELNSQYPTRDSWWGTNWKSTFLPGPPHPVDFHLCPAPPLTHYPQTNTLSTKPS